MLTWIKAILLAGFLAHLSVEAAPDALAADAGRGCRRGDGLRIQDLDMTPDPVIEGERVREWKIRIRLEGRRECETNIVIRDGQKNVGRLHSYNLRPGLNEVTVPAANGFRLEGREQCFQVQVDLDNSPKRIDAERRFCATQRTLWSMREPGDRRWFNR